MNPDALTDLGWYWWKYRKNFRSCACYSNNQILLRKKPHKSSNGNFYRGESLGYYPNSRTGINLLWEDLINGTLESGVLKLLARRLEKLLLWFNDHVYAWTHTVKTLTPRPDGLNQKQIANTPLGRRASHGLLGECAHSGRGGRRLSSSELQRRDEFLHHSEYRVGKMSVQAIKNLPARGAGSTTVHHKGIWDWNHPPTVSL